MRKINKWISKITALFIALFGFSSCSVSFDDGSLSVGLGGSISVELGGGSSTESGAPESGDPESGDTESGDPESGGQNPPENIVTDDLSIHFMYFGNLTSGDSTLIKVGNTEVLIDAGSTEGSADTIVPYIRQYCTDGILEYVIATHAHADHIAAFTGEGGIFASFECKTIIDYANKATDSQLSKDYEALRDEEVAAGAKHYTALECWNNANGAQRSYTLGENVTLHILYQKYYEETTSNENNYSVCTLLSQEDNHYLFTGDLERSGEKSLVASNELPKCKVYKGGHHGSDTSSTMDLLNVIQPEIVCVCSCCGDKHGFVKQEFIDNVANFTDKVYITTYKDTTTNTAKPLNGNIVVTSNTAGISVNCSNNDTLFKDTNWFKNNRVCPEAWKEGA